MAEDDRLIVLTESATLIVPAGVTTARIAMWGGASEVEQGAVVRKTVHVEPHARLGVSVGAGGRVEVTWLSEREVLIAAVAQAFFERCPEVQDTLRRRGEHLAEIAVDVILGGRAEG